MTMSGQEDHQLDEPLQTLHHWFEFEQNKGQQL